MQSNKLRKLQIYNLISCLIISTIIFFIYNNIPFLNDLLGHLSVNTSFSKPSCEGEGFIFCRPPFIKFLKAGTKPHSFIHILIPLGPLKDLSYGIFVVSIH